MFSRSAFSPTGAPSAPVFRSEPFGPASSNGPSSLYSTSPTSERHPVDKTGIMPSLPTSISDPQSFAYDTRAAPAVLIRKLPRNTAADALRSMLIFANDLIDVDFIPSPYPEDSAHATAVARFQTSAGALEAQQKLNGKPNTSKDANMIIEVHSGTGAGSFERRNTVDGNSSRAQSSSASSGASAIAPPPRSRYGSTFQPSDKVSPPLPNSASSNNGEFPIPESSAHFQNLFSPQSPLANGVDGHHRVSGKSMINDDSADDETGELLKDPVAYAKSGQNPLARRPTNPQIPISRFGNLSLATSNGAAHNLASPPLSGLASPRTTSSAHSSISPMSPSNNMSNMGPNGAAYMPNYARSQLPPVNPADQNPPCNTLYVGNLPIDTSEDELKSVFSKQRGYKRLCFRTKQNGPMCFVEFEDVSFATKTLNELYGHLLHNSVKGGIRLSFSKNPLGVRSGQTNGLGPSAVMSPQAMAPGYGGMMAGSNFSSASGPPPGLSLPPGLINGGYRSQPVATGLDAMFANPFGMHAPEYTTQVMPRQYSGGVPPTMGSGTYGIDGRNGFNEYSFGA